ncbi:hypothetical protein IMX26_13225 [Clostridium sp. 'deep sea']|uniref:hypothetical protein n=1 Tax=Clostridium sp. 'deep sea' TaxID=2779445 RepID=UPI00189664EA|nr:hypothetical protein [Clostridium sp. 'deep sea']QOR34443.1 hypothetical protein IMX26_13225 [Clostridium sp. 'deep sea']
MITSERLFDALPHMLDIYDKLDLDKYRKKVTKKCEGKKVDATQLGIDTFKYVIRNAHKVKDEFFNVVAKVEGKTVQEIKEQSYIKTVKTFMDIAKDKELHDFFK